MKTQVPVWCIHVQIHMTWPHWLVRAGSNLALQWYCSHVKATELRTWYVKIVQVMACYRQAPSHCLGHMRPRFISSYGVIRPQCVRVNMNGWKPADDIRKHTRKQRPIYTLCQKNTHLHAVRLLKKTVFAVIIALALCQIDDLLLSNINFCTPRCPSRNVLSR